MIWKKKTIQYDFWYQINYEILQKLILFVVPIHGIYVVL